jgi:hypothetical protein
MSEPLVVNLTDGTVWTRRGALRGGESLYAPADVCSCPPFVMATLAELAEHGIAGSADALPVPVGSGPRLTAEREREIRSLDLLEMMSDRAAPVISGHLAALLGELGRMRARVAQLETERHSTNEALSDAVEQLRADRDRIAELEEQWDRRRTRLVALQTDALEMRGVLSPAGEARKVPFPLGETLAPAVEWLVNRVAELEAQASAVRGVHVKHDDSEHCRHDGEPWPCPTIAALNTTAGTDPQDGTLALRAEDTADITTLAPAQHADATYDPRFRTISLELTATQEQWAAWQKVLSVDLARTTNRGSCATSHATWRGIHVVIRCWFSEAGRSAEAGDAS